MEGGTLAWWPHGITVRRLFPAVLTSLLADAVGFSVLSGHRYPRIRDLCPRASWDWAMLLLTNLILLPVLLSKKKKKKQLCRRHPDAALRSRARTQPGRRQGTGRPVDLRSTNFPAPLGCCGHRGALVMGVVGLWSAGPSQIGDLEAGASRAEGGLALQPGHALHHLALRGI